MKTLSREAGERRQQQLRLSDPVKYYKARLSIHRRTMRYWSGVPDFRGFGPSGRKLQSGYMAEQYERACMDAESIAEILTKLGVPDVKVVDIQRTFRCRWNNPSHPEVLLYPNKPAN